MSSPPNLPLFIREAMIDWDEIAPDSYILDIPTISGLSMIGFHKPITGDNGTGKSTLLEALLIRKVVHGTMLSLHTILIRNSAMPSVW